MRRTMMVLVIGALALSACSTKKEESGTTRPASTAKLAIVEPQPGAKLSLTRAPVRISLENATILPNVTLTKDVKPNEGHIHVMLDSATISLLAGAEFDLAVLAPNATPPVTLTPGQHLLQVEFVAGDHIPFSPRVVATTTFVLA